MKDDKSIDRDSAKDVALLISELQGDLESLPGLLESNKKAMQRIRAGAGLTGLSIFCAPCRSCDNIAFPPLSFLY
jgi:hypothetical protein